MEGAILDRKLRYGHERMIMSLRKAIDFESRLERTNFSFCSRRFEVQVDRRLQCRTSSAVLCKTAAATKIQSN